MRKSFIISALLFTGLFSFSVRADTLQLQQDAPDRYVVVKGDTLWDISSRFLKTPWRWPEIWKMNRDEIKNPHWIYPGDVIVLDKDAAGNPTLRVLPGTGGNDSRLSPRMRVTPLAKVAVPALPMSVVGPFLTRPLVVDAATLNNSPRLVAGPDDRVMMSVGDKVYAVGLDKVGAKATSKWYVYRPGKVLPDPESTDKDASLGVEAVYLGDVEVLRVDDVSTLKVSKTVQEIRVGDRLIAADVEENGAFVPHAPASTVRGLIISSFNGVQESGQYYIVTINRGSKNGLERGHVVQAYRPPRPVVKENKDEPDRMVPAEQYADIMLFRVFDRVSYGLVMHSDRSVHVGDEVREP